MMYNLQLIIILLLTGFYTDTASLVIIWNWLYVHLDITADCGKKTRLIVVSWFDYHLLYRWKLILMINTDFFLPFGILLGIK